MSSHETQLCTLKWHEQYHANFQHLFSSKTPRIVIGLNENFPFALQMGLEENAGKESSQSVTWMEVVQSLVCG